MFNRETVIQLLGSENFIRHRTSKHIVPKTGLEKGRHNVDGAVIVALRSDATRTVQEYCHNPSLVQHTGSEASTMGYSAKTESSLFPGEEFDARSLVTP
jgi:hypothetical protein